MTIFLNNHPIDLPNNHMTIEDLLLWKEIKTQGTAVAINDKLLRKDAWNVTKIEDMMRVSIITAAFGG